MITLRLFAQARQVAGEGLCEIEIGEDEVFLSDVLDQAVEKYGTDFDQILALCKIWLNGEQAERTARIENGDEIAILPPVSGG